MQLLDLTLRTPEENLALDEALVDEAEADGRPMETLRLWESPQVIVVVGRGSQVGEEVNLERCTQDRVPVLRRTSGGAAIVTGPGCLMYSLVLHHELRPSVRHIDAAHALVLNTHLLALGELAPSAVRRGTSDLALGELKFSGNSLRARRNSSLYHGTLLYDFGLSLTERFLKMPPRQPDYRRGRPHAQFVCNLAASAEQLRRALAQAWDAHDARREWPRQRVSELVARRYSQRDWNHQR